MENATWSQNELCKIFLVEYVRIEISRPVNDSFEMLKNNNSIMKLKHQNLGNFNQTEKSQPMIVPMSKTSIQE